MGDKAVSPPESEDIWATVDLQEITKWNARRLTNVITIWVVA
jgi:hypothetical protein